MNAKVIISEWEFINCLCDIRKYEFDDDCFFRHCHHHSERSASTTPNSSLRVAYEKNQFPMVETFFTCRIAIRGIQAQTNNLIRHIQHTPAQRSAKTNVSVISPWTSANNFIFSFRFVVNIRLIWPIAMHRSDLSVDTLQTSQTKTRRKGLMKSK